MSVYSDYRGQPASQQWAGGSTTTPSPARAAPSKLTEEQLLLLQQQWSQRSRRLRSDQRSACSARSSVSGVQYSRVTAGRRPVSSSCAGRVPTTPFFETPVGMSLPAPADLSTAPQHTSTRTEKVFFSRADEASGFTAAGLLQPPLQPKLIVRRRTDADVGTGADEGEDISPVGRLRNRHTSAGAGPSHHHSLTYGGSPFIGGAQLITTASGSSSSYSTFAPYTPSHNATNPANTQSALRLGRTLSLPGRCSTPSSTTASLAGFKYACSGNASGNRVPHGQDDSSCDGSSSSSRQVPSTPQSWALTLAGHPGLQSAYSALSSGSAALQPASSLMSTCTTTTDGSTSTRSPSRAAVSSGPSSAAGQGALGPYSSSLNYSTGSWTPVSTASSGVQTPFSTTGNTAPAAPKSCRGSSTGLPPLAPAASGAFSAYSLAATVTPTAAARLSFAGAAAELSLAAAYCEEGRSRYSRVSSTGSFTGGGPMQPRPSRHSAAGGRVYEGSVYGDEDSCCFMASVPEVPSMHAYPTTGVVAGRIAASPMAASAAAAGAAIAEGYGHHHQQQQQQHASHMHSFLPALETVLTGQSELTEDAGSPRANPGCMLGLLRALGIRKTPNRARQPRNPRRRKSLNRHHKAGHSSSSPKAGSRLGQVVVPGWPQQQQEGRPRENRVALMTASYLPARRQDSVPAVSTAPTAAAAAAAAAPAAQPGAPRHNGRAEAVYLQRPQQVQEQALQAQEDLGYSIAAVGPDAVAAAGVCEPASTGTGTVSATTVLYNSSPRGIYRYSSPNAGISRASAAAGYAYSSSSCRMSSPTVTHSAAAPSQQSVAGMRGRLVSTPGVAAAVAAAAAAAASRVHDSRPLNRVQLIAQNLEPHGQQQAPELGGGFSGHGKGRSYRTPSTPGSTRSYTSSSGALSGVACSSTGSAMAAAESNFSNSALNSINSAAPVLACDDFDYSASSGTITTTAAAAAAADTFPADSFPRPHTLRCSIAGSACGGSSSGDMLLYSNAAFRPSSRQQQQQQLLHFSTESRSHRVSGAGSTVSTASERRLLDRTYAEVVSSPRLSLGGSRTGAGTGRRAGHVAFKTSGPRQLQPVSLKGQLSWQPRPRGYNAGYLSTK